MEPPEVSAAVIESICSFAFSARESTWSDILSPRVSNPSAIESSGVVSSPDESARDERPLRVSFACPSNEASPAEAESVPEPDPVRCLYPV